MLSQSADPTFRCLLTLFFTKSGLPKFSTHRVLRAQLNYDFITQMDESWVFGGIFEIFSVSLSFM